MRRRLYFVLPDVASAEQTLRDLLLARIEVGRIHCLARRDLPISELPETNFLQKTDVVHGAGTGIAVEVCSESPAGRWSWRSRGPAQPCRSARC